MNLPSRDELRRFSVLVLVGANLLPVVGVLAFGWRLADVLLLFWLESAIIGLFTIVKMISTLQPMAAFLVPFFMVHFGMFMLGHLVFLSVFFVVGVGLNTFSAGSIALVSEALARTVPASAALLLSHGASFVVNFLRGGERRTTRVERLFFAPYPRIIVMHVTVLFGAFATFILSEPRFALVLLVVLKIVIDVVAHVRERSKLAAPGFHAGTTSPPPSHGVEAPPPPEGTSLPGIPGWPRRP